jgi:hypothetical protein
MDNLTEIEFYIGIDQDGDFVVVKDEGDVGDRFNEEVGVHPNLLKVIKMTLNVPLPKAVEVAGTVPDKGDEAVTITIS